MAARKKEQIDIAKIAGLVVGGTGANLLATQLGTMTQFQDDAGLENQDLTAGAVLAIGVVGSLWAPKDFQSVFDGMLAVSGAEIISGYTENLFQGVSYNAINPNAGQANTIY